MKFKCYELIINFYTQDHYKSLNYDKSQVFLNKAEEYLKEEQDYYRVLFLKGRASLLWPNFKKINLKQINILEKQSK